MTDENVALFSQNSMGDIFNNYKHIKEKLALMEEMRNATVQQEQLRTQPAA
jgi:hypothetical protein